MDTKKVKTLPQCDNEVELANQFNQFYMDEIKKIRDTIPDDANVNNGNEMLNESHYNLFQGHSFDSFDPVTIEEIKK